MALLEVTNLKTQFFTRDGVVNAVDGVSFTLEEGETLAIVGESGSGKSVTALSLMRLIQEPPGQDRRRQASCSAGRASWTMDDAQVRAMRGDRIAMIFQDPMTSLNPVFRVGFQIGEALRVHKGMDPQGGARARGRDARPRGHPQSRRAGRRTTRTSSPAACVSGR